MLQLHLSNRIEDLAERMIERLAARDALEPDAIVVPSAAMRRSLELAIARRLGICMNVAFGYPAHWIWRRVASITGASPERSPFDAAALAWQLYAWFGGPETLGHARLRAYLSGADAAMRFELASRAAAVLDRYVTYRQDWLEAWARGNTALPAAGPAQREDEAWQAQAWRAILTATGTTGAHHPAQRMFESLEASGGQGLPESLHVFGVPELPPLYLDIFRRLAKWMRIDLYLLDGCRQHWFEIRGAKQLARLSASGRAAGMESGNALLAAWGEQSKAFLGQALEAADWDFDDAFVEPEGGNLLQRVQRAILDLEELPAGSLETACYESGISIHVCHGLARELEVLHDQLLARFDADPRLSPGDVLVVTPDLERAAPLIDAVFGSAGGARHIPYAITGRAARAPGSLTGVFLELLDLRRTRYEANRLHDLLRVAAVARAFGLDEEGIETAGRWMRETGMHWGLDASSRRALGVPEGARHTLAASLESLFLGYTLPAGAVSPVTDAWLHPEIEGRLAFQLGGLWRFARELRALRTSLAEKHGAAYWQWVLLAVLDDFFAPEADEAEELGRLRAAIGETASLALQGAGADALFPFEVFRLAIEERIGAQAPGAVPSGRVTFGAMAGLRGLPWRLICCIGLDHAAFPASPPELEFDLMAAFPRTGDRRLRSEQRNVFLDLLLAAREAFYVSYSGRGMRDDRVAPPSVVVEELVDALLRAARAPEDARRALIVEHPLQAFSRRYFDGSDPRLFSYRAELCGTAQALASAPRRAQAPADEVDDVEEMPVESPRIPFFRGPLNPPADSGPVALEDLARFFLRPAEFVLRRRLGLSLRIHGNALENEDPFAPDFEAGLRLRAWMLRLIERGLDPPEILARMQSHPDAPAGRLGEIELTELLDRARIFFERRARAAHGLQDAPFEFRIDTGEGLLSGTLGGLGAAGMLRASFAPSGARARIECWVHHLALCAVAPPGIALRTQFLGELECFHFESAAGARERLAAMLRAFRAGQCRPLPFFPRAGLAYVAKNDAKAARKVWMGSNRSHPGEADDPWIRLAFREDVSGAIGAEFERLTREILAPLRVALKEGIHAAFA